jgi:ATP-binding cassette, subfamily C (CFTR/MRP), member 4
MFDRVLRATPLFFEQNPSGRILNRFSSDMDNIDLMLPVYGSCQRFLNVAVLERSFPYFES